MEYSMDENALKAYETARKTAKYYSNEFTGTEHLLYGILKSDCAASKIFAANGFTPEKLCAIFEGESNKLSGVTPTDSDRVRELIPQAAYSIAAQLGASSISPDHLMLAILDDLGCVATDALYQFYNVNIAAFKRAIIKVLQGGNPPVQEKTPNSSGHMFFGTPFSGMFENFFQSNAAQPVSSKVSDHGLPSQLAELGVDVTEKARQNKLDPVIGREQEVARQCATTIKSKRYINTENRRAYRA